MNVRRLVARVLLAIAWLAVAALISFGAAGVVGAMNHVPGTPARAELTWTGDQAAEPALDAATGELQKLSDQLDTLSETARRSLTEVVAGDIDAVQSTIITGTDQLASVQAQAVVLDTALAGVPGTGTGSDLRLSADIRHRYDELARTHGLTDGLEANWAAFTGRALDAANLTGLLTLHDQQTAAAAKEGSAGHYKQALALLAKPDATLADARTRRDRLASTSDVTTLTSWIDRNAAYDKALRTLYQALLNAKGRVTDAVRKAFAGEQAARKQLPADTRGLVVIMSDIAQGGLNQAVIAIEQARGAVGAALDVQHELQSGTPLPG